MLSVQVDKSSVEVLSFSRGDGVNVELKLSGSAVRATRGLQREHRATSLIRNSDPTKTLQ